MATLDRSDAFDVITAFDTIHDQAHPARVLATIAGALRPSGTFLMVDIRAASAVEDNLDLPWAPFLYSVSTMHCMTVSLGLDGDGLGTVWGEQVATRILHEAGFTVSRATRSRAMRSTTTTLRAEWLSADESHVLAPPLHQRVGGRLGLTVAGGRHPSFSTDPHGFRRWW